MLYTTRHSRLESLNVVVKETKKKSIFRGKVTSRIYHQVVRRFSEELRIKGKQGLK